MQENKKRKYQSDEPQPRRYTWPRIVIEMRGSHDTSSTRSIFSLGRFLKSTRRSLNKGGSDLLDPSQHLWSEWIPTIIVSSTKTMDISFTSAMASELCLTNWQIRASSKSSYKWCQPSLLPRKERPPKLLGLLLKPYYLQVPVNKSVLTLQPPGRFMSSLALTLLLLAARKPRSTVYLSNNHHPSHLSFARRISPSRVIYTTTQSWLSPP
ncbi:hypothetical protein AXF42_Ash007982 [Apostasia shenzhenica]|uniref:Uncharacterized protein n=1 Tax=Apostasia shenzhenica TaxID=1088818 RepID=A0A2I0B5W8_9ASPA|nr:hypothetical protein AXF42_Ash007982 [Apostasia shenzhenica]